ncbi:MAG: Stp1/IreP family PP2C-type Ser/Thr phosphatase [Nitrospiraceae bacterium]
MSWHGTGLTNVGQVRPSNQDAYAVDNDLQLWIVADGMGGHPGGDVASRSAVEALTASIRAEARMKAQGGLNATDPAHSETELRRAVTASNRAIRHLAVQRSELAGMGTTVVALRIACGPIAQATIAHIGDSRAYLLRGRTLTPVTRDHSLVEDHVRVGLLSPEEALVHPLRHVLTRALGTDPQVEADLCTFILEPSDLFLLCSDGLTKMLDDAHIVEVLLRANRSPELACRALIQAANDRGGVDNTTVVVVTPGVLSAGPAG